MGLLYKLFVPAAPTQGTGRVIEKEERDLNPLKLKKY